ncbi:17716_t:CDS:2 [Dentiscutata erythropus]|uniref:17716_t:CDS:1 n=1 Tax=Dentiscutata erythropus TaxID=1348616 RepID=A0A9N8W0H0_9GLOM|nr:17716_t:CDS:2 [Dentiscutata erythropus]
MESQTRQVGTMETRRSCPQDFKKLSKDLDWLFIQNALHKCSGSYITPIYGISRNTDTGEYVIVLHYIDDGDLREHIHRNPNDSWENRLYVLTNFAIAIQQLHANRLVYGDFHSGNLLCAHDHTLVFNICRGVHPGSPGIQDIIPKCYSELMIKCWDANLSNRPDSLELRETIRNWWDQVSKRPQSKIATLFSDADNKHQSIQLGFSV